MSTMQSSPCLGLPKQQMSPALQFQGYYKDFHHAITLTSSGTATACFPCDILLQNNINVNWLPAHITLGEKCCSEPNLRANWYAYIFKKLNRSRTFQPKEWLKSNLLLISCATSPFTLLGRFSIDSYLLVPASFTSLVLVLAISIRLYSFVSGLYLFSDKMILDKKILNVVTSLTATSVLTPCLVLRKMVY